MRIEPAPSLALATGRSPAATAEAAPPLEPPAVYAVFHGFAVAGWMSGSTTGMSASSDVAVLPTMFTPSRRVRRDTPESTGDQRFR